MKRIIVNIPESPSKSEELTALAAFAEKLPVDTYLRPWLTGIQGQVEQYLKSDIVPLDCDPVTIRDTARELAATVVAGAKRQAEAIERQAKAEADRMTSEANRYYDRKRVAVKDLKATLRNLAQQAEDMAERI